MVAEEVVAAYATNLFIRSEAEARRPVVLLSGERTNVYGVLEKHFRETALPPSERFWRTVRMQWTPMLDTWRPRVNGVQLKVLAGARLPESEEEWGALRAALNGVRQHLRPDSSVDRLHAELRDFVAMVVSWWENRKKTENGGANNNGTALLKRVASAGLLLGGGGMSGMGLPPPTKKPCLEFIQLGPPHHPPPPNGGLYQTMYAAPEIVHVSLLGGGGGSGRLPDRAGPAMLAAGPGVPQPPVHTAGSPTAADEQQQQQHGTQHGGCGYLQHLTAPTGPTDSQLFEQLFHPGGGGTIGGTIGGTGANTSGSMSPRDALEGVNAAAAAAAGAGADAAAAAAVGAAGAAAGGYSPRSPLKEGSADNQVARPAAAATPAIDGKRFVTLNVGGHRFLTTAATLAAVEGSYFCKLAQQASSQGGSGRGVAAGSEFFVDRSGKMFEYVLDFLRSCRFGDGASNLPKDERTLQLLAREAEFYQMPELAERARAGLAAAAVEAATAAAAPRIAGDDTPSDVPANFAAEGSAHGGQLMLGRWGSGQQAQQQGGMLPQQAQHAQQAQQPTLLDALFMETGFQPADALASAQASLLEQINATVASKQGEGFTVADFTSGTEREGQLRNLFYHVLLRKTGGA